ncbi:MAG: DUF2520 domain-containing protein [Elusimicrobia bacterium]|nr:DUF2520 domain-containing protein [Elusimicrobiota bacterium]
MKKYGIAGHGRASKHLQRYFRLLNVPFAVWTKSGSEPHNVFKNSTIIFVLIKDSEIENFIKANPLLKNKTFIHFSGSLETGLAWGYHPLMTFAEPYYTLEEYENIPFITGKNTPPLEKIAPELKNPLFRIPENRKSLYHALCVMGSNFPVILWTKILEELNQKFGIPRKHILNYFEKTLKNFKRRPGKALTGPFTRKDILTINKNIRGLRNHPLKKIYLAFRKTHENR